jgi:hypothetical protein
MTIHRIGLLVFLLLTLFLIAPAGAQDSSEVLSNFEAANTVIGQKNFTSTGCTFPGPRTLCDPYGEALGNRILFISDSDYSRVLGFRLIPTRGAAAAFALGQIKLTTTSRGTSKTALNFPTAVAVTGTGLTTKLFVNDFSNSRVLIWNKLPIKSNSPASVVVGQPDFTSNAQVTTQSGLKLPEAGLAVAGGKLFVADRENHRIMIWNTIPITNGTPADVVLGQPDFTTSNNTVSQTGLDEPEGLWSDGTRLVVADSLNSRVLIWNSIPTTNGAPADVVVGQPGFTTGGSPNPPTAQSLNRPIGVTSDGTRLFVADTNNNRILVYSPFPTANNPTASFVIGQADFVHGEENAGKVGPTAQTLSNPYGLFISGKKLYVSDFNNARVLIFGL